MRFRNEVTASAFPRLLALRKGSTSDQDTAAQVVALNAAGREHIYREKASGGRWERLSRPLREEAGAGFRSLTHAIDKPKIGSCQRSYKPPMTIAGWSNAQ